MSLYSGIKFASGPADTASPENSSSSSVAPAGNGTGTSPFKTSGNPGTDGRP
jgi:hypothetical protein